MKVKLELVDVERGLLHQYIGRRLIFTDRVIKLVAVNQLVYYKFEELLLTTTIKTGFKKFVFTDIQDVLESDMDFVLNFCKNNFESKFVHVKRNIYGEFQMGPGFKH